MSADAATYTIKVDWDGDGDFDENFENVTGYCQEVSFERGRDDELQQAVAGIAEIRLVNTDNRFSPENIGGALYGYIFPRRRVELKVTSPESENLFTGYISEYDDDPSHSERTILFYCVDQMDVLCGAKIKTPLYEGQLDGYLVAEILSLADWSEGASWRLGYSELDFTTVLGFSATLIDAGLDTIPYAWWHKLTAREAVADVEEACLGFFYVNGSGQAVYEDRHHRLYEPHLTSQFTFNDTMAEILPKYRDKDIKNEITATFTPREVGSLGNIWLDREVPYALQPGETKVVEAEFVYPCKDVANPVATTDYTANSSSGGGGVDLTADIDISTTTWAQGARLEITNSGSGVAYLTLLKIRGKEITELDELTKIAYDLTSQQAYQKRTHDLSSKLTASGNNAQDFCNYYLSGNKDPRPRYVFGVNTRYSSDVMSAGLTLKISDRITLQSSRLGLDDDFFIEKMRHEITNFGKEHNIIFTVTRASDEEYWILDTSELGTGTRLAY